MLLPSDVKVDPHLVDTYNQLGAGPQNNLQSVYSKARSRFAADRSARGLSGGSAYAADRIGHSEDLSGLGLKSKLEGALGNTAYTDAKSAREYDQNYALAKQIGDLMKPSSLEEALGALSVGARAGGQGLGLYQSLGSKRAPAYSPDYGTATPGYNGVGYNPFDFEPPYDYMPNWR